MKTEIFLDFLPEFTPKSPKNQGIREKNTSDRKIRKKGCLASQRNSLTEKIIINLKTNNYINNQQKTFLLFILHKLVSLIQAVMQSITAIHVNLGVDRLVQTLNERIHGLQERRIACNACGNKSVCR